MSLTAPAGLYKALAIVVFNNLPIQGGQNSTSIQVLTLKVEDNITPILAILVLVIFFVVILFGQALHDSFKLKNISLYFTQIIINFLLNIRNGTLSGHII